MGIVIVDNRAYKRKTNFPMFVSGIKGGDMTLLFGCRRPDMDHIYKEETEEMKRKGVLKEVYTAYSRQPGQAKVRLVPLLFKCWFLPEWSLKLRFGLCLTMFFKKY